MLETLANLAELIGGAAVLGGVAFAVWQIRQYRQQRRDAAAIEIVRTIQSREFAEAFRLLSRVPDGISLEALRAKGSEYEDAARSRSARWARRSVSWCIEVSRPSSSCESRWEDSCSRCGRR